MDDALSKTEIMLEKFTQIVAWAKEYEELAEIKDLKSVEVFWENHEGMEFSTEEDFFEVAEEMVSKIYELSKFIRDSIDLNKCYPDGIPL